MKMNINLKKRYKVENNKSDKWSYIKKTDKLFASNDCRKSAAAGL